MPLHHSLSHNFESQVPSPADYSDWIFPSNLCSSYSSIGTLLRASMTNSSLTEERARHALNEQVLPDTKGPTSPRHFRTASTEDSDEVVVVQPSFDDHGALLPAGSSSPHDKLRERQSRSPDGDKKEEDTEELRNPSSPDRQRKGEPCHTRNLSALLDATSISDDLATDGHIDTDLVNRKHRRIFSGDVTNPNLAHRRLNSVGNAAPVSRRQHHREPSEGLDILSAAANATKEEIAAVAGSDTPAWSQPPSRTLPPGGHVSSTVSSSSHASERPHSFEHESSGPVQQHQMEPPPHRQRGRHPPLPHPNPHTSYAPHYQPGTNSGNYHHYPVPPIPGTAYYGHHYGSKGPIHHHYPAQYPQQPLEYHKSRDYGNYRGPRPEDADVSHFGRTPEWEPSHRSTPSVENSGPSSSHQGVQTFVTAISVGNGNRVLPLSTKQKNAGTNTDAGHAALPAEVGHHRKMSSFSSLGTILGSSSVFPASSTQTESEYVKKDGHHRASSSSVSFLNGLDVGIDDANFLRNLQASNASAASYRGSPPPTQARVTTQDRDPIQKSPIQRNTEIEEEDVPVETPSGILQLAAGGTSKRVRRKCTAPGCTNRVVQGGLCISHGAKRKTCKYPGCTKNVKKAGLCSTHGPARKRCEYPDCPKVAVQGGRCIAHGAKKKLCCVEGCIKQAILSGMCKKHHDQAGRKTPSDTEEYCRPVTTSHKPTHTRGLSIFQEMSADTVSSLLNDPNSTSKASAQTSASSSW